MIGSTKWALSEAYKILWELINDTGKREEGGLGVRVSHGLGGTAGKDRPETGRDSVRDTKTDIVEN
jgi:hypothetical protein